jgi:hypothetical protein
VPAQSAGKSVFHSVEPTQALVEKVVGFFAGAQAIGEPGEASTSFSRTARTGGKFPAKSWRRDAGIAFSTLQWSRRNDALRCVE